jgi:S-DNA-T family DNA segregation ATPase FtsK/SpoIIIE
MPRGISVNKIAQMADDIAMTLASNGSIRVEAPIPGKNSVGIEVPNAQVSRVSLRELIDSEEFRQRGNPLSFVLGKDINGDIIFCNLDKMPHVLVAGSTGSGKSVCLNTMLLSMCYKAGPQDLRLILVDPKMVEFSTYNGLPHLLIPEVIIGKDLTINALDWSIKEMERRYALFAKNHVVNINEYNKLEIVKSKKEDKLPFIVIVVDELADLMLEAKREIEDRIAKLAAKARAAGIHLVLATQRPSVDVITGTVKANLPSRIAFALTNYMDSKTVLDGGGAEKLLGKGDMLFKPQDKPEPRRIQGAYVSNPEIAAVVKFIKDNNNPVYDDNAKRAIKNPNADKTQSADVTGERDAEFDPVLKDALRMFIQVKQGSASMIQRRYSVGSSRAGRIIDQMEMAGFVGPMDGAKPRQVLITMEEFKAIFGED